MSVTEMNELSHEIRQALLQKLSKHGGHFGPNLEWSKQPLPCIMCLTRRKTKLYSMYPTKVILIKY